MDARKERLKALHSLTNEHGVYALCDLDSKPIYVGQSTEVILARRTREESTFADDELVYLDTPLRDSLLLY